MTITRVPEHEAEHFLQMSPAQWEYGMNMTTEGYRWLLLNNPEPIRNAQIYRIKGRSLGAGVYRVTAAPKV